VPTAHLASWTRSAMTVLCPPILSMPARLCIVFDVAKIHILGSVHDYRHRATDHLRLFLDFIIFIQCCHYYSFVTSSTRRSSTSDTDHRLIVSTFTSHRLRCPLRDLPCTIAGHASSHHTYHLVSHHPHQCDTQHPTTPPTPPPNYLPGRLSP
jgi:hypothetical protein